MFIRNKIEHEIIEERKESSPPETRKTDTHCAHLTNQSVDLCVFC